MVIATLFLRKKQRSLILVVAYSGLKFERRLNKWKPWEREGRARVVKNKIKTRKQIKGWRAIFKCPADVQQSKRPHCSVVTIRFM